MANIIKELLIKITTNADKANKDVKELGKTTEETGKKSKTASEGVGKMTDGEQKLSKASKTAKEDTHKLKSKVEEMVAPVKDAGDALNVMKGALGAFGVSVGVQELINQFKTLVENIKAARDAYTTAKTLLIDYNGVLDENQQKMVDSIYRQSATNTGFTDKEQVTKAVAYTDTFFGAGSSDVRQGIATELSSLQALGQISDTATFATQAKEAFSDWGISVGDTASSMDYLYNIAVQTKIPLETLMDFLIENGDVLQELGYDMKKSASMIGDSFADTGSTKAMQTALDTYEDEVETNMETMTEKEAKNLAKKNVTAYTKALDDSLPEVTTAVKAWAEKVNQDVTLSTSIREGTHSDEGAANPSNIVESTVATYDAWQAISNKADQLGVKMSQTELIDWASLIEGDTSLQDVLKLMEETNGQFDTLNNDGLKPTNTALDSLTTLTSNISEYIINTFIPNLGSEQTAVDNLTTSYWNLYAAMMAVNNA